MKLSIIVPACNEEHRIGGMLEQYLPFFMGRYKKDVEFIVVINGTNDRTEHIVREFMHDYSCLQLIVEPGRVGKGGALMQGFTKAEGALIGFVDADGATPPDAFNDLVERIGESDIIIASRWMAGSDVTVKQSVRRRLASRCFNLLVRFLFGIKSTDTQCGAKLIRKKAIKEVLPHLGITQWAFDVDLLFQLRRAGYKMTEIPTKWEDVAGSQLELGHASLDMFFALVRLRLVYSPLKSLVRLYRPGWFPFLSRHETEITKNDG